MYRIILERDYLQVENESLNDIIVYCDSINESNEDAKSELIIQLGLKDQQINNSKLMYDQEHEKYLIAEETIKGLRLKKNTFAVSGVVILVGSVILLVK
jgi:hypothetical protein